VVYLHSCKKSVKKREVNKRLNFCRLSLKGERAYEMSKHYLTIRNYVNIHDEGHIALKTLLKGECAHLINCQANKRLMRGWHVKCEYLKILATENNTISQTVCSPSCERQLKRSEASKQAFRYDPLLSMLAQKNC
jgi:hypothetical protein